MTARIETFPFVPGVESLYGFRVVSANGEKIAGGEGYDSRGNAERGARTLIETILELAADAGGEAEYGTAQRIAIKAADS